MKKPIQTQPKPARAGEAMLDELLETAYAGGPPRASAPASASLVGECTDDRHPTLIGRYQVRWEDEHGTPHEHWLPGLAGLSVRTGDRVIITRPDNWPERVITGVIDGFAKRPAVPTHEAGRIELRPDETVVIADNGGQPLLEIRDGKAGPQLRLCQPGLALEAEGHLQLRAESITMASEAGPITIESAAHVIVSGEVISLN